MNQLTLGILICLFNMCILLILDYLMLISGAEFAIAGVYFITLVVIADLMVLFWLIVLKIKSKKIGKNWMNAQLMVAYIILIPIAILSCIWLVKLPSISKEIMTHIDQEDRLKLYKNGQAPIETGVWEYQNREGGWKVPCNSNQIHGRVEEQSTSADSVYKFYTAGNLDSLFNKDWSGNVLEKQFFTNGVLNKTLSYTYYDGSTLLFKVDTIMNR